MYISEKFDGNFEKFKSWHLRKLKTVKRGEGKFFKNLTKDGFYLGYSMLSPTSIRFVYEKKIKEFKPIHVFKKTTTLNPEKLIKVVNDDDKIILNAYTHFWFLGETEDEVLKKIGGKNKGSKKNYKNEFFKKKPLTEKIYINEDLSKTETNDKFDDGFSDDDDFMKDD